MSPTESLSSHDMLGMRLDYATPDVILDGIMAKANAGRPGYCCVTNVHQCILVHDDPIFATKVNAATFVIPDSVILQRARAARYNIPFKRTQRGADIMLELCKMAATDGVKIALVGGKDDAILAELKSRLTGRFPELNISYSVSPPFRQLSAQEDETITNEIRESGAGLIFVGLGCPKQENWMADHTDRIDAMMIGVGAAFDFNAGVVKTSPEWVHKVGLEWLYRLVSEPRRLWKRYLTTSPRFLWLLTLDAIRNRGNSA